MTPRERDLDAVASALLEHGYRVGRHGEELRVHLTHHSVDGTLTVDERHTAHLHLAGSSSTSTDVPGSALHADPDAVVAALRDLTR